MVDLADIQFQVPPVHSSAATTGPYRFIMASFPLSGCRRFIVSASKSPNEEANPFISQNDLTYLLKLGAGSIVGAAAIKYGSILVPEITRPNITRALIMIFTPVLVSVLVLIKESSYER